MLMRVAAWVPIWRADTRSAALLLTAPWVQHAMETLPEAVRTGRQTFSTAHGTDLWSYLAAHPRDQADFDQAMAAESIARARAVLAACTSDGLETIVVGEISR